MNQQMTAFFFFWFVISVFIVNIYQLKHFDKIKIIVTFHQIRMNHIFFGRKLIFKKNSSKKNDNRKNQRSTCGSNFINNL